MLLRNRTFMILMLGEIVAGTGIWISVIANLQFMQHLVPTDFGKSLILMVGLFIGVLISPQAGVWVDKYDKRKILLFTSVFRCLAPISMFAALHFQSIPFMLLSVVIMQLAATVYMPAVQASLPAIIPKDQLLKANSVYFNISTIARIGGTALAGVMVVVFDLFTLYLLSLIFYVILVALNPWIRIPRLEGSAARIREKMKFKEIFPMIRQEPAILIALMNAGVLTLFLGGFNLLVLKFSTIQHSPDLMGWIYTVEGTSILVISLFAKKIIGTRNLMLYSNVFMFLFALAFIGLSFSENRFAVLGSFAVFGCAVAFFFPMISTIFQIKIPQEAQGRFFSFRGMLDRIMFQVALLATGACLDWFGISTFMIGLAILAVASGISSLTLGNRRGIDIRHDSEHSTLKA
ncbi:MFS transporter [Paenibacillus guangzhouensis]|uniref:MFS transporter n=1 Tax=Paenibacillus guangzhouensis TaxID=1473112 RepID=UPI001D1192A5|nr:MFS transporter [Paenibacillus guangzhouensis]